MRFQAQHPLVTLVYYIGVFMALFLFNSLCYTAVILAWMLLLACRTAGGRKSLRLLFGAVLFGGILLLINPLVNSEGLHILFYLGERPITLESLLYGTHNLLLIVALLLVFPSLNLLMDSERILFLFSRFLQASGNAVRSAAHPPRAGIVADIQAGGRRPAFTPVPHGEIARCAAGLDDGGRDAILPYAPGARIWRAKSDLLQRIPLYGTGCGVALPSDCSCGSAHGPALFWRGEMDVFSRLYSSIA